MVGYLLKVHEIELACSYDLKIRLNWAHKLKSVRPNLIKNVVAKAEVTLSTDGAALGWLQVLRRAVVYGCVNCFKHNLMWALWGIREASWKSNGLIWVYSRLHDLASVIFDETIEFIFMLPEVSITQLRVINMLDDTGKLHRLIDQQIVPIVIRVGLL